MERGGEDTRIAQEMLQAQWEALTQVRWHRRLIRRLIRDEALASHPVLTRGPFGAALVLRTRGILVQIGVVESTREPRIGCAQPTCAVDQSLGLAGRSLAFSDDGLQPIRGLLGIIHQRDV